MHFTCGSSDRLNELSHGADSVLLGIAVINKKRIYVAIKDSAHEPAFAIDNRTVRVATSDVGRADKVKIHL